MKSSGETGKIYIGNVVIHGEVITVPEGSPYSATQILEETYEFLYDTEDGSRSQESLDASAFEALFEVSEQGAKLKSDSIGKEVPLLKASVIIENVGSIVSKKHEDIDYFTAELFVRVNKPSKDEKILNYRTGELASS